jgi:hypothetical protein
MIRAFERNHQRKIIAASRDIFRRSNKFSIRGIVDINTIIIGRDKNQRSGLKSDYIARFIEVIDIII